jgi:hypothetical protein
MSHTPGPWTYRPDGDFLRAIVQRGNDGGGQVYGTSTERENADARLMAAAPDLLRALRSVLSDYEASPCHMRDVVTQARAAIAKATGAAK